MENIFSSNLQDIIDYSREEAERLQNKGLYPEHLLLGILRDGANKAVDLLRYFGVDCHELKSELETAVLVDSDFRVRQTERVLKFSELEARRFAAGHVEAEHLLLALLRNNDLPMAPYYQTMRMKTHLSLNRTETALSVSQRKQRNLLRRAERLHWTISDEILRDLLAKTPSIRLWDASRK